MTRRLLALLGALLLVGLVAAPGRAAGTGGIELSPYPGVVNGREVTAFHVAVPTRGSTQVRYSLRNTGAKTAGGLLYAASATRNAAGGWSIGEPGSARFVRFPARTVTLTAHETRLGSFPVSGRVSGRQYEAVVVEVRTGSVVTRAATLVYLRRGRVVPLPALLVAVAVLALLVAAGAVALVARRRPRP